MNNDEKIKLECYGRIVYLPLQQVQLIVDSICSEYPDNAFRSLFDLFVANYDSEEIENARRQEVINNKKIAEDIE